jgi:flagellar hook assembly protein FlgD
MSLTNIQIATLRSAVLAEPSLTTAVETGDDLTIMFWCNTIVPTYKVWNTTTPTNVIGDAIIWANLTPTDTPDTTTVYTNRALMAQAKQLNIQIYLQGRETVSTNKSNIRSGIQDALTNLPTGVNGANSSGGWATVKGVIQRAATNAEKVLAVGTGTSANPSDLTFEGNVTLNEASLLR